MIISWVHVGSSGVARLGTIGAHNGFRGRPMSTSGSILESRWHQRGGHQRLTLKTGADLAFPSICFVALLASICGRPEAKNQ